MSVIRNKVAGRMDAAVVRSRFTVKTAPGTRERHGKHLHKHKRQNRKYNQEIFNEITPGGNVCAYIGGNNAN